MSRFWDTSVIVPLLVREPATATLLNLLRDDENITVWWGTRVECASALSRKMRDGGLNTAADVRARVVLDRLARSWSEVQPTERVRSLAQRLLAAHALRAADALQLASALVWTGEKQDQRPFVCLDNRLRQAAHNEGFAVRPAD